MPGKSSADRQQPTKKHPPDTLLSNGYFFLSYLFASHLLFLLLDHFLNHISAYRTILSGCQVSVVTVR